MLTDYLDFFSSFFEKGRELRPRVNAVFDLGVRPVLVDRAADLLGIVDGIVHGVKMFLAYRINGAFDVITAIRHNFFLLETGVVISRTISDMEDSVAIVHSFPGTIFAQAEFLYAAFWIWPDVIVLILGHGMAVRLQFIMVHLDFDAFA
jgi:hypothetical protein